MRMSAEIDNEFVKHLIPITEFTFSKPISNFAPGTNVTTGTIQPGVIYLTSTYQVAVEAIVPLNGASGHGVGVVASARPLPRRSPARHPGQTHLFGGKP